MSRCARDNRTRGKIRKAAYENEMFYAIRKQLDSYPLKLRIRFAWRILRGKF